MNKENIISALRRFVHRFLTPTQEQRDLVVAVYTAVCLILGRDRCYQIGSYPRYTAIRPPHDLDVLYTVGVWPGYEPDAVTALTELKTKLEKELRPPPGLTAHVSLQTHSITVSFRRNGIEEFAVDVVPGWTAGNVNEFGDEIYFVPEIILRGHRGRLRTYKRIAERGGRIDYIRTDPKGYIKVAAAINGANEDFRRSVKFAKRWKVWAKDFDDAFKLKSFHIEQIITGYYRRFPLLDVLDATLLFLQELPQSISHAQIADRADASRFIDEYVNELTATEKAAILRARDAFLERLKSYEGLDEGEALFAPIPKVQAASASVSSNSFQGAPALITDRSRVDPRSNFASEE